MGLLIFLARVQVQAQSGAQLDAVAGEIPTIDGTITGEEWDDASSVANGVTSYVKQDGENLYIAIYVSDNTPHDWDGFTICLDVAHNAGLQPQADDTRIVTTRFGDQGEYVGNGTGWATTTKSGWDASTSSTSTKWQAEIKISYAKLDDPYGKSKIIGVQFTIGDFGIPGEYHKWPGESDYLSPYTWGDLISSVNWVPEFPTEIAIPLTLVTILIAVVIARKVSRKSLEKRVHRKSLLQ